MYGRFIAPGDGVVAVSKALETILVAEEDVVIIVMWAVAEAVKLRGLSDDPNALDDQLAKLTESRLLFDERLDVDLFFLVCNNGHRN